MCLDEGYLELVKLETKQVEEKPIAKRILPTNIREVKSPKFVKELPKIKEERARYFAEMLGVDVGVFYKRRDLSKVVNGKSYISFDLVVETMYETGKDLRTHYRETSEGGLAKKYCRNKYVTN